MYTTCRVGVLSSEISKHSKISPPPSLRSHLISSPMGVFSGDYGTSKEFPTICSYYIPWLLHVRDYLRGAHNNNILTLLP